MCPFPFGQKGLAPLKRAAPDSFILAQSRRGFLIKVKRALAVMNNRALIGG
jgi:hypothetical protein